LQRLSDRVSSGRCPPVYPSEFRILDEARNLLSETEGLEPALQSLVAWLVGTRAIHELRHVESGIDIYEKDRPATCSICAADATNVHRAEVAAIVAEWAWSDSPAATLFRFCAVDEELATGALAIALKGIDYSCAEGPHPDLTTAARALEESALGRSTPIAVSLPIGQGLPLDRAVVRMREAK
ncbi:MAG: hypothetical protein AAF721_41170, partial [Myxococcota bacterium]